MDSKLKYKVIGLMSGTSLDGLDVAYCILTKIKRGWKYSIEKAITVKYSSSWTSQLANAHTFSGEDLVALDVAYGRFLGETGIKFIQTNALKVDFIASHGHTIFHQPRKGFTYQLGNGTALHAACGLPVVCDFRSLDVALGGEGAPLVPAGDKFLFSEYDVCLNLGGIANLSRDVNGKRIAFDICFANMGLNFLTSKIGKSFDAGGALASDGEVNTKMLKDLTQIYDTLRKKRPSLGREIFEKKVIPILDHDGLRLQDKLRTFVESTAIEISTAILSNDIVPTVLCTGGGTYNVFLISRLLDVCGDRSSLIIPPDDVVKFKEALVFAFLGVLRVRGEVNCLKSVTGGSRNSSGGIMIGF